jgi:hypothetical protein
MEIHHCFTDIELATVSGYLPLTLIFCQEGEKRKTILDVCPDNMLITVS